MSIVAFAIVHYAIRRLDEDVPKPLVDTIGGVRAATNNSAVKGKGFIDYEVLWPMPADPCVHAFTEAAPLEWMPTALTLGRWQGSAADADLMCGSTVHDVCKRNGVEVPSTYFLKSRAELESLLWGRLAVVHSIRIGTRTSTNNWIPNQPPKRQVHQQVAQWTSQAAELEAAQTDAVPAEAAQDLSRPLLFIPEHMHVDCGEQTKWRSIQNESTPAGCEVSDSLTSRNTYATAKHIRKR